MTTSSTVVSSSSSEEPKMTLWETPVILCLSPTIIFFWELVIVFSEPIMLTLLTLLAVFLWPLSIFPVLTLPLTPVSVLLVPKSAERNV